jgi:hypothetical protein
LDHILVRAFSRELPPLQFLGRQIKFARHLTDRLNRSRIKDQPPHSSKTLGPLPKGACLHQSSPRVPKQSDEGRGSVDGLTMPVTAQRDLGCNAKTRGAPMPRLPEHGPGDPAPGAGTYEQINIFGRPNGVRVDMNHGHPFPRAPIGHTWRRVEEGDDE